MYICNIRIYIYNIHMLAVYLSSFPRGVITGNLERAQAAAHTAKSVGNLVKSNPIWIVSTLFKVI